jgi:hypothetical protein
VVRDLLDFSESRLQAMTSTQMEFLGLKEFKYDEATQEVRLTLQMDNVGDVAILLQLKDRKLDSAKVSSSHFGLRTGRI